MLNILHAKSDFVYTVFIKAVAVLGVIPNSFAVLGVT